MPNPICRQSRTESRCTSSGCNGNPSSRTSFNPYTAMLTALRNSLILNCGWPLVVSTKAARFSEPSKHEPPLGKGSSAQLCTTISLATKLWNSGTVMSYTSSVSVFQDTSLTYQLLPTCFFWFLLARLLLTALGKNLPLVSSLLYSITLPVFVSLECSEWLIACKFSCLLLKVFPSIWCTSIPSMSS